MASGGAAAGAFLAALAFTLRWEGGVSTDARDRGGYTCRGVTQVTYDRWRRMHGLRLVPVATATEAECESVYFELYWLAADCDRLSPAVALVHFDSAVNHGVAQAARFLQTASGVDPDGALGPVSFAAIVSADPVRLTRRYLRLRGRFYVRLVVRDPSQAVFLRGWLNRLRALKTEVRAALAAA